VSLRDVERAMIVFKYMYDMMKVFEPLMNSRARKEITALKENGKVSL
jgi:hypothetical protein